MHDTPLGGRWMGAKSGESIPRPRDEILDERVIRMERKEIVVSLRQNQLGRLVRIEEIRKHDSKFVLLPACGLDELIEALKDMRDVA